LRRIARSLHLVFTKTIQRLSIVKQKQRENIQRFENQAGAERKRRRLKILLYYQNAPKSRECMSKAKSTSRDLRLIASNSSCSQSTYMSAEAKITAAH
jgi:hypothetical protein